MTSLRPVPANEMDLAKNIHETADFGENIPVMPPQTIEKFWIFDESEYVVKDPSSEILGWVKRIEGKPGQASSASKVFIVFPDLSYFQGSVGEDFLPNGSGIYTFPGNYSKISGDWKDGEISKGGIYVSNTILYYGNFSNGMPTLEGEYYRTGELIRKDKAKTNEEKEELRQQLVERIGSNVWSRKSNFIDWDSTFSKSLSSIISAINFDSEASELMHLVNADESSSLEFKSSVWATYNNATGEQIKDAKKNLSTEDSIVKTIAAFCNTDGGTLVIGVQDRPEKKVIGIDGDLQYSGKQKDMESFQNSLSEVIRKATNNDSIIGTIVDIRVEDFDGEKICIVGVKQKQWVWVDLKNDKRGAPGKSIFFVRSGPQTVQLSPESAHEWRREKESTP